MVAKILAEAGQSRPQRGKRVALPNDKLVTWWLNTSTLWPYLVFLEEVLDVASHQSDAVQEQEEEPYNVCNFYDEDEDERITTMVMYF